MQKTNAYHENKNKPKGLDQCFSKLWVATNWWIPSQILVGREKLF